jgi:putative flippase GtrA
LRFATTGGLAGLVQIALLHLWTRLGCNPLAANAAAFLIAAQVNFWLSDCFTWGDRLNDPGPDSTLRRRWVRFHLSILGTSLLNMAVFAIARATQPIVVAGILGIGSTALANFILGDRFVFRSPRRRGGATSLPAGTPRKHE